MTVHASEGGHWYDRNGNPVYEVLKADGSGMKKTTLREARILSLVPGITSIIKCSAKPALVKWQREQSILAALTLPRKDGETEADWLKRVFVDMDATAANAAEEGTRIHAAVQGAITDGQFDGAYREHVDGVLQLLRLTFGEREWRSEQACAYRLGYGTKADLFADGVVIDFKSKDGDLDALRAMDTYDEHHMQLAATRRAIGMDRAQCGIVMASRTHPGAAILHPVSEDKLERGLRMFDSLLSYWKARNNYDSGWEI